jgi:Zn-dependent peptidase ImmA (M78 family)/transcriptional regulator with XRE-family HTH domain
LDCLWGRPSIDYCLISCTLKKGIEEENTMDSARSRKSLIRGSQLRKARQLLQLTVAEVSQNIQVSPDYIERWESGEESPNVRQLEMLARLYGREIDYFLRESPAPPLEIEFRGRKGQSVRDLSRETKIVIAKFDELCRTAVEFEQLLNKKLHVKITRFKKTDSPDLVVKSLREQFGANNKPIPHLRDLLEREGVRIFELAVPKDEFSGLSFWHSEYGPAILVNAKEPKGRRNFTLAHELAHLLYDDGSSVCYIPIPFVKPVGNIEFKANQVAVKLLLPEAGIKEDFEKKNLSRTSSEEQLGLMAGKWGVSLQALGYRLEDLGLIEKGHTDKLTEPRQFFPRLKTPRWERQLGRKFVATAFEAYHKGFISSGKLSHALGLTVRKTLEEIAKQSGKSA